MVRGRLVAAQRRDQQALLGRGLQLRGDEVLAIAGQRALVAPALVVRERVVERPPPRQPRRGGIREQLGVAQRVADPERHERVLVAAGVADERPPGPYGARRKFGSWVAP